VNPVELDPSTVGIVAGAAGTLIGGAIAEFYRRTRKVPAKPAPPVLEQPAVDELGPPDSGVHAAPGASAAEALSRIRVERIYKWTQGETEHRAHDQMARQTVVQTAEAVQAIAIGLDRMRADEDARERRLLSRVDRLEDRVLREHAVTLDTLLAEIRSR
jgi:hypothetical protein